jgi:preprotein translocase subunit SecD
MADRSKLLGLVLACFAIALGVGGFFYYRQYLARADLSGGTELVYSLETDELDQNVAALESASKSASEKDPASAEAKALAAQLESYKLTLSNVVKRSAGIVRHRIEALGLKEVRVEPSGMSRVQLRILLPRTSPDKIDEVKLALNRRGQLTFHIVTEEPQIRANTMAAARLPDGRLDTRKSYINPSDGIAYMPIEIQRVGQISGAISKEELVATRIPAMDGSHITKALAKRSSYSSDWEIEVAFDATGSYAFALLTGANINKRLAILVDNEARSAPVIKAQITGVCQITGLFSKAEAEQIAAILTSGGLPAELKLVSQSAIVPSTEQENTKK